MNLYPHIGEVVMHEGASLNQARAGMIVLHSRAGTAKGIMRLAPQAEGNSWYPEHFSSAQAKNELWVTSSLLTLQRALKQLEEAGVHPEQVVLFGFSQGHVLC
jgi:predicted esterase